MLTLEEKVRALRACPLFETLPHEAVHTLAMTVRPVRCPAGEIFLNEDESDRNESGAFVIVEGEAVAFKHVRGQRVDLARFSAPDVVGEFELLAGIPRSASVEVLRDLVALRLDRPTFEQLVRAWPDVALRLLEVLVLRFVATRDRFLGLSPRA